MICIYVLHGLANFEEEEEEKVKMVLRNVVIGSARYTWVMNFKINICGRVINIYSCYQKKNIYSL